MAPLSKWIDGLSADGTVRDAARVSIEARLATVAYWLPLAARPVDGDIERVHQLRVATRRAIAALKLYRDWLPKDKRRWFTKRLKDIRQAAGNARDHDVLYNRLHEKHGGQHAEVLQHIAQERAATQPEIVAIADRCHADNRFQNKSYKLLGRIEPQDEAAAAGDASFLNWAGSRLHSVAEKCFDAQPAIGADWSALHQFRIAGKKLRYAMELLAPAFGSELREKHYPIVQELQEKLGTINDFVVAREILQKLRDESSKGGANDELDALIGEQEASRDQAIAEFHAWWTPDRAAALRTALIG
jgi:CHAD domain-containing protein